jgi:hypothetical protein
MIKIVQNRLQFSQLSLACLLIERNRSIDKYRHLVQSDQPMPMKAKSLE